MFVRYGQFKANLYQQNPTDAGFFPLSGSNRYGLSIAGDSVWVMSNKTTLNVRGSFYNMTDEFYNPSLLLGDKGCQTTGRATPGTRRSTTAAMSTILRSTSRRAPARTRTIVSAARGASGSSIPTRGRCRRA